MLRKARVKPMIFTPENMENKWFFGEKVKKKW
jgi:hypothetical protein